MRVVDQDADPRIFTQLLENEQVHPTIIEDIINNRVGAEDKTKSCYALVVETEDGPIVLAGIYVYRADVPVQPNGELLYSDLPGDVDRVKSEEVKPVGVYNTCVFWTISNNERITASGAGRVLVEQLYKHLLETAGPDVILTTLSPVRAFLDGKDREEELKKDEDTLRREVMKHLLSGDNGVCNFHLGNGAYVGDIKFNPDNEKDWMMVNYVYPSDPEVLQRNRNNFDRGKGLFPVCQNIYNMPMGPEIFSRVVAVAPTGIVRRQVFASDPRPAPGLGGT